MKLGNGQRATGNAARRRTRFAQGGQQRQTPARGIAQDAVRPRVVNRQGWGRGKAAGPPALEERRIGEGRGVSGPAHRDCGPARDALRPGRVAQRGNAVGGYEMAQLAQGAGSWEAAMGRGNRAERSVASRSVVSGQAGGYCVAKVSVRSGVAEGPERGGVAVSLPVFSSYAAAHVRAAGRRKRSNRRCEGKPGSGPAAPRVRPKG